MGDLFSQIGTWISGPNSQRGTSNSGGSGNINPTSGVLSELLGYGTSTNSKGGVNINQFGFGKGYVPGIDNGLFGQPFFKGLQDYIYNNPAPIGGLSDIQNLFSQIPGAINQGMGTLNSAVGNAQQMAATGNRTDIAPIQAQAERAFTRQDLPQLQELFSGQTGTFGTDFLKAGTQAAADMRTNLGALQSQLDEAAAGRMLQGNAQLGQLGPAQANLMTSAGSDWLNAALNLNQAQTSQLPGVRAFDIYNRLNGSPSNLGPVGSGFQPNNTSQLLQGLGGLGAGLGNAAGQVNWGQLGNSVGGWLNNAFSSAGSLPAGTGGAYSGFDMGSGAGALSSGVSGASDWLGSLFSGLGGAAGG